MHFKMQTFQHVYKIHRFLMNNLQVYVLKEAPYP